MGEPSHTPNVFLTGATGFLGKQVLARLLERGLRVQVLVRARSRTKAHRIFRQLRQQRAQGRLRLVQGDLTRPGLGIGHRTAMALRRRVTHVIHLGARYHLAISRSDARLHNVIGTRNVLDFVRDFEQLRRFHHVSTLAVAGDYPGHFLEDDLEVGQRFHDEYARSKFEAEHLVRSEKDRVPVFISRPGIVVGDSRTGEYEKRADGLYYLLRVLRWLPSPIRPPLPAPAGEIYFNIVPVDYVADGLTHLTFQPGPSGMTFSLTDPAPRTYSEIMDLVAQATGSPRFPIDFPMWPLTLPTRVRPVRVLLQWAGRLVDMPVEALNYTSYRGTFDTRNAEGYLAGVPITCPDVEQYVPRLIDRFLAEA